MSDVREVPCTVCKGTKTVKCYSCVSHGVLFLREDRPPTHVELELANRFLRERDALREAEHAREIALLGLTEREQQLLEQNRALEARIRLLRKELTNARDNNHRRNLELDALHYVWCDGGCPSGVHRYDGEGAKALSEDLVKAGEDSIGRLRTWWENHKSRQARSESVA